MSKRFLSTIIVGFTCAIFGAELRFDFSQFPIDQTPTNFQSTVSGEGKPGDWKIIEDDVPPLLAPLSPHAPKFAKRNVLAQTAQDPTDEHFPLLIFKDETFADFTLTTRFKIVRGDVEQMAGIAFRIQDEKNYYVLRASGQGSFRFYKFVAGLRSPPIGPEVQIATNVWHDLKIECKANQIFCWLNGKDLIPPLTDTSFAYGKIGFWTKSDSVSYFVDTKIDYVPRVPFAQSLVREIMQKYPRLRGLKIFALKNSDQPMLIANADEKELGTPGGEVETNVLKRGKIYYNKKNGSVEVTLPLRDRNGDIAGALRTSMTAFPGETQDTAIARAVLVKKAMEERMVGANSLLQ